MEDYLEKAKEAAEFMDGAPLGEPEGDEWRKEALTYAAIAQAEDVRRIAVALEKIADERTGAYDRRISELREMFPPELRLRVDE